MVTDTLIGSEFAGYRIESLLGRGGMATVYAARDPRLGRRVAIKIVNAGLSDDGRFHERFIRESQLAASLDHPNIIPIYEAGEFEGTLFIAMRWVDGTDLNAVISRERHLPPARTMSIIAQVAKALDAAHERGLVHRDVKPANILITKRASIDTEHTYLSDFGLAKNSTSNTGLTETGQFLGTLDYIAPEQIEGTLTDGRADIYALGAVMYQCIVGTPPFQRDNNVALMYAHLQEPPPSVSAIRSNVPIEFDNVIAKAMAKAPDDRYQTGSELITAARLALTSQRITSTSTPAPTPEVVPPKQSQVSGVETLPPVPETPVATPAAAGAPWRDAPILVSSASEVARQRAGKAHSSNRGRRIGVGVVLVAIAAGGTAVGIVELNHTAAPGVASTSPTASAAASPSIGSVGAGLTATSQPPSRAGFSLGYDPITKHLLLEGGKSWADDSVLGETWSWDGQAWKKLPSTTASPHQFGTAMAIDPSNNQLTLIGSDTKGKGLTWTWNGQTWAPGSPTKLGFLYPNLAAFPPQRQLVVNGDNGAVGQAPLTAATAEVDVWDGHSWQRVASPSNPEFPALSAVAFDPRSRQLIEFSAPAPVPTTYSWDGSTWTQIQPATQPPPGSAVATTDMTNGEIILLDSPLGGSTSSTWVWDGHNWLNKNISGPFLNGLTGAYGMAWDPAVKAVILVTMGVDGSTGTWVWTGNNWRTLAA